MKAILYNRYGPPEVLHLSEVEKPVPKDDEVLIQVQAVSINGADREGLAGRPLYARIAGLFRPGNPILGSDIAGIVEAAGSEITEYQPGDEVFGEIPGYHGGFAEYACAPERTLMRKPAGLSFEQAAAIPQAGTIALRGIRTEGRVQPGQHALINGAGGSTGSFAVQLAKLAGAEVTGVENTGKLDFVRSLGADQVIDYTRQDFTKSGKQYDLILDVMAHRPANAYSRALKPGGMYLAVGGSVRTILQLVLFGPRIERSTGKHVRLLMVPQNREDLMAITELIVAGQVRPVIDRVYPLSEVAEAMRYVVDGGAKGKVVIRVADGL
jgi:NADPH:quinone reductase-like Zn-dependent oxidoreductase